MKVKNDESPMLLQNTVETDDFDEWNSIVSASLVPLSTDASSYDNFRGSMIALQARDVGVVRGASVAQVASRSALRCRRDPTGMLGVLIQRHGRHEIRGEESRAVGERRSVTFFELDSPYVVIQSEPFAADAMVVPRHRLGPAPQLLARARRGPIRISSGPGAIFASTIDQLLTRLDDCGVDAALRLLDVSVDMLRIVIGDLEAPEAPADVLHRAATDWISRHLGDPDVGPETVAAAIGVSVRHLHRVFALAGVTVAAEIRSARLARVRADLLDPLLRRHTIASIGVRSGLVDPAGLSRMFRREFGLSPSDYRMEARSPGGVLAETRFDGEHEIGTHSTLRSLNRADHDPLTTIR